MSEKESFLSKFSSFFITNYRLSILLIIGILVAGWWSTTANQRQDFPEIPLNFAFVSAVYPGASPEDIEQKVLAPVEEMALAIDGVDQVRSSAQQNFGTLQITTEDVSQVDRVTEELNTELGRLGLPEEVDVKVQTFDAAGVSLALGIVGYQDQTEQELLAEAATIKSRLETSSKEIKKIEVIPENKFSLEIVLDPAKLAQARLSPETVKQAVQSAVVSLPGGTVRSDDGREEAITITPPVGDLEELKKLSLGAVTLGQVAELRLAPENDSEVRFIGYTKDGKPDARQAVYMLVYKKSNGDIIRLSDGIKSELDDLRSDQVLAEGVDVVVAYDNAPYVRNNLNSLLENGYFGLILIFIVLLFFINLRTAVVVVVIIPLSLLITLFLLVILGYTLNILTLFGLILTLGILVDNAIVMGQGMVHEIEKGVNRKQAAFLAIRKFAPAVVASTMTTVIAFIPFASIEGIMGDFLKYIPYTIIIMLLASMFLSLTITPLFGSWLLKQETYEARRQARLRRWEKYLLIPALVHYGQNLVDALAQGYGRLMTRVYASWKMKVSFIVITLALLGLSLGYFAPQLKFEQFPLTDSANMQISLEFPAGTPRDQKNVIVEKVADQLIALPYFQNFYMFDDIMYAIFAEPVDRPDKLTINDLEAQLDQDLEPVRSEYPDVLIEAEAASYGPPSSKYQVVVEFLGEDRTALDAATADLEKFMRERDDVERLINSSQDLLVPSVRVSLQPEKLQQSGVNPLVASATVGAVFGAQIIGSAPLTDSELSNDIKLVFTETARDSVDDLRSILVPTLRGSLVPLSSIAVIEQIESPISINRLDAQRVATLSVSLKEGTNAAPANQAVKDYLTTEKLKSYGLADDGVKFGGEFADFTTDFSNLQIVFMLAMLGVYLVLVLQFSSFLQPALIMVTIPLAMIGVFPGLVIINSSFNMISGLGIIALIGIVVNNAIVFISTYNRYRLEQPTEGYAQALVRAGQSRLSPILSTTITTAGGILPLTIADPFWTGLGTSLISGLIFSTFGSLMIIPIVYAFGHRLYEKMSRRKIE